VVPAEVVHPIAMLAEIPPATTGGSLTFDAATCRVKPEIGKGVLLDIRDWMRRVVSVSLEMLKRTLTLVLVTLSSLEESGTDEAKFHSSSSLDALVLCARLVDGADIPPPSRSIAPDAGGGGLTDC
jgi:hypothetical protein